MSQSDRGRNVPVIVGVGQLSNKDDNRIAAVADLAIEAIEIAAADAGLRGAIIDRIDAVYAPVASVFAQTTLADDIGDRLGVSGPRVSSAFSGAAPLDLLAQAANSVVNGSARVALVAGAVAEASVKRALIRGIEPPSPQAAAWSQGTDGHRDDPRMRDMVDQRRYLGAESAAGIGAPSDIFALMDSVFAFEAGRSPIEQRQFLGELMAPFTKVAAANPFAWQPVARTAAELSTPSADNRMVAEPYTKRMMSFPTVDLASAIFVTTEAEADAMGIGSDQRVYLHGSAGAKEVAPPSGRPAMNRSVAMEAAIRRSLAQGGLSVDDIATFDVYSCFPAAVQLAIASLKINFDDSRGFTLTGGLPYFGGPAANYLSHALIESVHTSRQRPEDHAMVIGLGGAPSDFAAAVLSATRPGGDWRHEDGADLTDLLESQRVPVDNEREGDATIEAITVLHDRELGPIKAPMIARFADGTRVGARAADQATAAALSGEDVVGRPVKIIRRDGRNVFELS